MQDQGYAIGDRAQIMGKLHEREGAYRKTHDAGDFHEAAVADVGKDHEEDTRESHLEQAYLDPLKLNIIYKALTDEEKAAGTL